MSSSASAAALGGEGPPSLLRDAPALRAMVSPTGADRERAEGEPADDAGHRSQLDEARHGLVGRVVPGRGVTGSGTGRASRPAAASSGGRGAPGGRRARRRTGACGGGAGRSAASAARGRGGSRRPPGLPAAKPLGLQNRAGDGARDGLDRLLGALGRPDGRLHDLVDAGRLQVDAVDRRLGLVQGSGPPRRSAGSPETPRRANTPAIRRNRYESLSLACDQEDRERELQDIGPLH